MSPSEKILKGIIPFLVAFSLLMFLVPIPAVRAQTYGPYDLFYDVWLSGYNVANPYQTYPGGTFYLNYALVDTSSSGASETITSIGLSVPWQTYYDTSLPVTISPGEYYYGYFTITIPSSEQPGNVTGTFTSSVVGFSQFTETRTVTIFANPTTLQNQINTLDSSVASLQSQVSSLQSELTAAQTNATNLRSTVTSLQGQISGLQSQLTTAKNNATSLQQSVVSLKSQLSTSQSQYTTAQSQLSNATAKVNALTTQLQSDQSAISNKTAQISTLTSQLSTTKASLATANTNLNFSQGEVATYSSVYLPVGVVVPSIVAVLFLVLYLRKGPRPSVPAARMSPPQVASAMAPPAAAASGSKFCPDCGAENKAIAKFCAKCGAGLS